MNRVRTAAGTVLLLLSLGACGGGGGGDSDAIDLKFIAVTSSQPAMEKTIAAFEEENPDVTVTATYVEATKRDQTFLTQLSSGNPPDLVIVGPGNVGPASPFQVGGKLLDLSSAPWVKDIPEDELAVNSYDEKVVTFPGPVTVSSVVYNKGMFDKFGWDIPTTTDELLALCGEISDDGKIPMAIPGAEVLAAATLLTANHAFVHHTVPDWNDRRNAGEVAFSDSPEFRNSLESLIEMKDAGCFSPGAAGTTLAAAYQQMGDESASMLTVSSALVGPIREVNPDVSLALFPFPGPTADSRQIATATSFNLAATAETKHPDEARAFIDYVAAHIDEIAAETGGLTYDAITSGNVPEEYELLAPLFETGDFQPFWPLSAPNSSIYPYSGTAMQGLLTGQLSVDDVLAEFDRLWDDPNATP